MNEKLEQLEESTEYEQAGTVSGGNVVIYYIPATVSAGDAGTEIPPDDNLWTKPLDDYTVIEGLLLLILCAFVALLSAKLYGGFKWQK